MGFPLNFKKHERISEQYRQIGNSVAIPIISQIAKSILEQKLLSDEPQTNITECVPELFYSY